MGTRVSVPSQSLPEPAGEWERRTPGGVSPPGWWPLSVQGDVRARGLARESSAVAQAQCSFSAGSDTTLRAPGQVGLGPRGRAGSFQPDPPPPSPGMQTTGGWFLSLQGGVLASSSRARPWRESWAQAVGSPAPPWAPRLPSLHLSGPVSSPGLRAPHAPSGETCSVGPWPPVQEEPLWFPIVCPAAPGCHSGCLQPQEHPSPRHHAAGSFPAAHTWRRA